MWPDVFWHLERYPRLLPPSFPLPRHLAPRRPCPRASGGVGRCTPLNVWMYGILTNVFFVHFWTQCTISFLAYVFKICYVFVFFGMPHLLIMEIHMLKVGHDCLTTRQHVVLMTSFHLVWYSILRDCVKNY
jgi:hypothetical protein